MEGFLGLGYLQNPKIRGRQQDFFMYVHIQSVSADSILEATKSICSNYFSLKGQKRGDLTVSNMLRERKWPDASVKEYQRKDEARIKLKSISSKRVNIKSPQTKSKKAVQLFKGYQITVNTHQIHSRVGDQSPKHIYG